MNIKETKIPDQTRGKWAPLLDKLKQGKAVNITWDNGDRPKRIYASLTQAARGGGIPIHIRKQADGSFTVWPQEKKRGRHAD